MHTDSLGLESKDLFPDCLLETKNTNNKNLCHFYLASALGSQVRAFCWTHSRHWLRRCSGLGSLHPSVPLPHKGQHRGHLTGVCSALQDHFLCWSAHPINYSSSTIHHALSAFSLLELSSVTLGACLFTFFEQQLWCPLPLLFSDVMGLTFVEYTQTHCRHNWKGRVGPLSFWNVALGLCTVFRSWVFRGGGVSVS